MTDTEHSTTSSSNEEDFKVLWDSLNMFLQIDRVYWVLSGNILFEKIHWETKTAKKKTSKIATSSGKNDILNPHI